MNNRFRMKKRAWKLVFSAQRTLRLGEGQLFINGKLLGSSQAIVLGSPTGRVRGNCPEFQSFTRLNRPISGTCEIVLDCDELERVTKTCGTTES